MGDFLSFWDRECINKEFIGWDPGSRFEVSLEIANAWRSGSWGLPVVKLLDSPTWPYLRSFLESFGILFWKASSLVTVYFNFFLFICLVIVSCFLVIRRLGFGLESFLLASSSSLLLFSIPSYQLYLFSGMLEIQGGLFLLMSIYGLLVFSKQKTILPIFAFLLLQTKYPYAILFLFSLTLYLIFAFSNECKTFALFIHKNLGRFLFHSPIFLFLPIPIVILILMKGGYLPAEGKSLPYIYYTTLLLVLILGLRFFWNSRGSLKRLTPNLFSILANVYLPSIVWILIHPDRFIATSNTVKHEQGGGDILTYFGAIFQDLPMVSWFLLFSLLVLFLIYIGISFYPNSKNPRIQSEFRDCFPFLFIPFIIVVGMSLFTPNRQERHIYHVYPSIILGGIFLFHSLFSLFGKIPIVFSHGIFRKLVYFGLYFFLIHSAFSTKPNLCYAGTKEDIRNFPLYVRSVLPKVYTSSLVLKNDVDSNHVNKPDTELEFALHSYRENLPLVIDPSRKTLIQRPELYQWNWIRIGFQCKRTPVPEVFRDRKMGEDSDSFLWEKAQFRRTEFSEEKTGCIEKWEPIPSP